MRDAARKSRTSQAIAVVAMAAGFFGLLAALPAFASHGGACPHQSSDGAIQCAGTNVYAAGTCRPLPEPSCAAPRTQLDCGTWSCICPGSQVYCGTYNTCVSVISCTGGQTFDACANGGAGGCVGNINVILSPAGPAYQSGYISLTSSGTPGAPASGVVAANGMSVDNLDQNSGVIASNSLRFGGVGSGEGIFSKRTAGGNQWGLDLVTNSISRMSVMSGGNVGIGTNAPGRLLQVGNNTGTPIARVSGGNPGGGSVELVGGTNYINLGFDSALYGGSSMDFSLATSAGNNTRFYTNALERMRITSAGNVGIGTTSPQGKLNVINTLTAYNPVGDMGVYADINDSASGTQLTNRYAVYGRAIKSNQDAASSYSLYGGYFSADFNTSAGDMWARGVYGSARDGKWDTGVYGMAMNSSGSATGVEGWASGSPQVTGVAGFINDSTATTSYGVRAQAVNAVGTNSGMYTYAAGGTTSYGLRAQAGSTPTMYGVHTSVSTNVGQTGTALYADAGTGSGTEYAGVFMNGNVGIGTATPGTALDVVGTAKMTGFQLGSSATAGQVLTANASGVGTWQAAAGGGTPGGANGQVQFNNAGAFGGDAGLAWDNTNKRLGVGTSSPSGTLQIVSTATYPMLLQSTGTATGIWATTSTAGTNDVHNGLYLGRDTTGTAAAGLGTGVGFSLEDASGTTYAGSGGIYNQWTDAAAATRVSALTFYTKDSAVGMSEKMRIAGNGNVGFGTINPGYRVDISNATGSASMRLNDTSAGSNLWTGVIAARNGVEKWFVGLTNSGNDLAIRRNGTTNDVIVQADGKVKVPQLASCTTKVVTDSAGVLTCFDPCAGITCSGHGTCSNGVCTCNANFGGANCNQCNTCYGGTYPSCNANYCSQKGTCSGSTCLCEDGYAGSICQSAAPYPTVGWTGTSTGAVECAQQLGRECDCIGPGCTADGYADYACQYSYSNYTAKCLNQGTVVGWTGTSTGAVECASQKARECDCIGPGCTADGVADYACQYSYSNYTAKCLTDSSAISWSGTSTGAVQCATQRGEDCDCVGSGCVPDGDADYGCQYNYSNYTAKCMSAGQVAGWTNTSTGAVECAQQFATECDCIGPGCTADGVADYACQYSYTNYTAKCMPASSATSVVSWTTTSTGAVECAIQEGRDCDCIGPGCVADGSADYACQYSYTNYTAKCL